MAIARSHAPNYCLRLQEHAAAAVPDVERRCAIALDHSCGVLVVACLVVELWDFTTDAAVIVLSPSALAEVSRE